MNKYTLAIVEDNRDIQHALTLFFERSSYFSLLFTAGSAEEFTEKWRDQRIDLLLCDIGLPKKTGIELTWYVKRKAPGTEVVMFTVFDEKESIFQALCAGASGYLLKNTSLPKMEEQLREVMSGGSVMSPAVARMVFRHFNPFLDARKVHEENRLTPREIAIVSMLQKGDSYKQTAEHLGVSMDTVKYHIRNIYSKLHVSSRAELMNHYRTLGAE